MFVLWLAACVPQWTVITPANPNPLVGATHLDLAPLQLANLHVGNDAESDYLARKDPKQQQDWARDKQVLSDEFAISARASAARCGVTLDAPGGPGEYTVTAQVMTIEPGFYGGVVEMPSTVEVSVQVSHRMAVAEVVRFAHGTSPSSMSVGGVGIPAYPSVTDRLRADGKGLGEILGDYVCARVAGK